MPILLKRTRRKATVPHLPSGNLGQRPGSFNQGWEHIRTTLDDLTDTTDQMIKTPEAQGCVALFAQLRAVQADGSGFSWARPLSAHPRDLVQARRALTRPNGRHEHALHQPPESGSRIEGAVPGTAVGTS